MLQPTYFVTKKRYNFRRSSSLLADKLILCMPKGWIFHRKFRRSTRFFIYHTWMASAATRQAERNTALGSNNKVLLVSAHSTLGLEGKFQLWKQVKTGFYNSAKNNTFTVINLVKSIRHHSKLQASNKKGGS